MTSPSRNRFRLQGSRLERGSRSSIMWTKRNPRMPQGGDGPRGRPRMKNPIILRKTNVQLPRVPLPPRSAGQAQGRRWPSIIMRTPPRSRFPPPTPTSGARNVTPSNLTDASFIRPYSPAWKTSTSRLRRAPSPRMPGKASSIEAKS